MNDRRRLGIRRLVSLAALAASALLAVSTVAPMSAQAAADGWWHTSGSRIVAADGSTVTIKAANWFGLETPNCAPHGLWSITLDEGLAQIAAMGFNTVRLPYSNQCLAASTTSSIDASRNPDLVSLTPLQLMDAVIAKARAHGLRVILDRHRIESSGQSKLWYTSTYSEKRWIDDWVMLANRYRDDPTVVGADLHNEPHGSACWGCGDTSRDWWAAATRAGNAVLAANPRLLIIVDGVERQNDASTTWWGGGLKDAGAEPVVLATPNRVVYSPHEYPASVYGQSWFSAPNYPANLPSVWEANWGYLARTGSAPIFVGEFGTKLETTSDAQWLRALVSYLGTNGLSFGYWSFNPNSGDTGGLVADDGKTPQTAKLAALAPLLAGGSATPMPSPSASATWTPSPTPTPTSLPSPGSAPVSATWMLQSAWQDGYVAEFSVSASRAVGGWTISWSSPGATQVVNAWGMTCAVASGTITCTGKDWAGPLAAGQSVRVGLQVAATAAPSSPRLTVTTN
ncbi:cellulase family glycosylhydrolase [Microbacterium hominis]|uniref:Endoglucanase n=1 Tax=Microbacterium hominis TaxID=162426 RepID=A0A0B4CB39_9MICO|nr:cellulase family glycosylhydrolase [Microbacterium hominis]KIC58409.1 glycosyl hydrolase family 5 [Microbacterium hominis]